MKKRITELISQFQRYINLKDEAKRKQQNISQFSSNAGSVSAPSSPNISPSISSLGISELDPLRIFVANSEQSDYRNQYLERLQEETIVEILNDQQYMAIGKFISQNIDLINELLEADNDKSAPLHIGKKAHQRDLRFVGRLPRTIEIDRNTLEIYALPSRKLSSGVKVVSRARMGAAKKVTDRILLNPKTKDEKLTNSVTKRQEYGSEAEQVAREIAIESRVYGKQGIGVGDAYISKNKEIVRTTDTKAIASLDKLINPDTAEAILSKDKDYDGTPESKNIILIRLVSDILECMGKIHDAEIIHNDIKEQNILVYLDENQNLRAKIIDFGLSVDRTGAIPAKTMQPVATSTHASPEVVSFVRYRMAYYENHGVFYKSLYADFNNNTYYGYEKYKQEQPNVLKDDDRFQKLIKNKCDTKDDMWAVGVTMYVLITGAYPTDSKELDGKVLFTNLKYMHIDTALEKFPLLNQLKPLIMEGLLASAREDRPDAAAAQEHLQNLVGANIHGRKTF